MIKRETKLLGGLAVLLAFGFALTWSQVGGPPEAGGENLPPETGPADRAQERATEVAEVTIDPTGQVFTNAELAYPEFSFWWESGDWFYGDAEGTIKGTGGRLILVYEHDPKAPTHLILPEDVDNRGRWIQRAPTREELEAWLRFTGVAVVRSGNR